MWQVAFGANRSSQPTPAGKNRPTRSAEKNENRPCDIVCQGCLGAFDTLWYHEYKLRLRYQSSTRYELVLHASRDFIYAVIFASLAWISWNGMWTWVLAFLLILEIIITLQDFIEEDRYRKVPPGERVMHALMGITYGAFLAYLLPELVSWAGKPTGFTWQEQGWLSYALTAMAVGVAVSGGRDSTGVGRMR